MVTFGLILPELLTGTAHGFVGTLLLVSGAAKRGRDFAAVVASYRLLPASLAPTVAHLFPPFEILLGLALLVTATAVTTIASAVLLTGLAGAVAINLLRGRSSLECGCDFGRGQPIRWPIVAANLALAAALVATLGYERSLFSLAGAAGLVVGASLFLFLRLKRELDATMKIAYPERSLTQ